MKIATVRQFRDRATTLLKEPEPILVTRRGKIVGFFLPASGEAVPLEAKREVFYALTDAIHSLMKRRRLTEESVVADFQKARAARRRR